MQKYGRRNIALLTIAPTGTTSLMAQTTSGIEPVFMPVYKRRRKVNPNDKDVRVDFVDEVGDSWEEYIVFRITSYNVCYTKLLRTILFITNKYAITVNTFYWV